MGTHPTAPSTVAASGQTLGGWLAAHPQALGDAVERRFGADLPFLFKVRRQPDTSVFHSAVRYSCKMQSYGCAFVLTNGLLYTCCGSQAQPQIWAGSI